MPTKYVPVHLYLPSNKVVSLSKDEGFDRNNANAMVMIVGKKLRNNIKYTDLTHTDNNFYVINQSGTFTYAEKKKIKRLLIKYNNNKTITEELLNHP